MAPANSDSVGNLDEKTLEPQNNGDDSVNKALGDNSNHRKEENNYGTLDQAFQYAKDKIDEMDSGRMKRYAENTAKAVIGNLSQGRYEKEIDRFGYDAEEVSEKAEKASYHAANASIPLGIGSVAVFGPIAVPATIATMTGITANSSRVSNKHEAYQEE